MPINKRKREDLRLIKLWFYKQKSIVSETEEVIFIRIFISKLTQFPTEKS